MNRYFKYILSFILFACSAVILSGISSGEAFYVSDVNLSEAVLEDDTIPRFPVKATQIKTYEDLNTSNPIDLKDPSNISTSVEYNTHSRLYIYNTRLGTDVISTPFSLSSDEYLQQTLRESMTNYFRQKNRLGADGKVKDDKFSLKDIKISMNPTDRLFGPGGLQFTANGYVEVTAQIKQSNIDNPVLSPKQRKRTMFDFKEDIQLNVNASMGDRLNFGMNYDTKSMFDFDSKRINLSYEGDEDAILKHVSAGNVSMRTSNSLINGGNALFGITTELQFGNLRVNAVMSQQESESHTVNTGGGVQTNHYEFKVDEYDENRHFFLAHYFRNNYDKAMSKLPFAQSPVSITRIEVWITNKRSDYNQARNIVAFSDIAENEKISNTGQWSATGNVKYPHNGANNLYRSMVDNYPTIRDMSQVTGQLSGFLEGGLDYEKIENARLLNTNEYSFNSQIGYLSLSSALQADEVLAVAFEYTANGKQYKVGEFAADIVDKYQAGNPKSGALFLKLLKPVSLSPQAHTWDLMMKNVYSIGASGIQKDKFRLNIGYRSDSLGTYINYLPEGKIRNELLLRVMNLDRLNAQENTNPDGVFDFLDGYTIRAETGRIYFPVVEPFGSHLAEKIGDDRIAQKYVYQELYDSTKTVAQQIAEKNKYKIYGTYRGSSNDNVINLNATNVPAGSVSVTAGGRRLVEGADYIIDYMSGSVTVINQDLLDSNTPVQISLEDRSFSTQRKTLMGVDLSYDINKNFNVGGTLMHYFEKPLTNKTEFGHEAAKNTLWGLNTSYKTESQWLTNMINKIPFVNATAPSHLAVDAEFAQLIAGHYVNKEVGAYSYLDDFETSQSRIDIKSPYAWTLASTPASNSADALFPEAKLSNDIEYGKNRAMLSWFMIDRLFTRRGSNLTPNHIKNDRDQLSNHFVREIHVREIYPNRDIAFNEGASLSVLNLSYYPKERGPYNLDATKINNKGELLNPEDRWGGITRKMDVQDFEASNIEYIEFWLMDPFVYNNKTLEKNEGGDFYINLGEISEDVLKDGKKFFENGMPADGDPSAYEETVWGRVPTRQSTVYAFDDKLGIEGRRRQDVGLNGLSTEDEFNFPSYRDYVEEYKRNLSPIALTELSNDKFSPLNDPSGDNYHNYRGADYDRDEVSILDRYKRYNGTEGNSINPENSDGYTGAAKATPDVEDINQDNTLNENEAYYQYKIELKPDKMKVGDNFIVDSREVSVDLVNGTEGKVTWYQFKVPLNRNKRVGNISNFKSIRFMRMFLTNFKQTTFLRFGTLQLVRGDWRLYEQSLNKDDAPSGKGELDVSTVNIEENNDKKPVNYVLPPGVKRVTDPDQAQMREENEQSLAMRLLNLDSGDSRAIYRNVVYDLRRYKRLQLFTHAEELIDGDLINNGELSIFLRLGSDYKNNYYEYEIPLVITAPGTYSQMNHRDREIVWPRENMFDFSLDILKDLKLARNKESKILHSNVSSSKVYFNYDPEKPVNRISVKGNPSLSDVNVIMVGLRNTSRTSKSAEVWINELRLSDFDDKGGWAAQGSVNLALSDLATINVSGRKETAGFGAIDQSLSERRQDDYSMVNFSTSIDLGRFIPEKVKLSVPFYYSYSNETITPEYNPYDQDVKMNEALSILNSKQERDSLKSMTVDKTTTKSINFNNVRFNIRSKTPMPYDPANFSAGYAFNETKINTPTTAYDVNKDYKFMLNYNYSPIVKTWEPFSNIKSNTASSRYLKSIGFNYVPSNIALNSLITRYYSETLTRDIEGFEPHQSAGEPNSFLYWNQEFYWDRSLSINWDFTHNLNFSFNSGTKAEIEEPYLQVNKKLNRDDYEIWRDSVWKSIRRMGNPLEYRQEASLTYQLPFRNIAAMDWINSSANYSAGYQWDRGARVEDVELGNIIRNNNTFDFKNTLRMDGLYNKSSYLKSVNDRFSGRRRAQTQRERQREEEKKKREQEVRQYKGTVNLSTEEKVTLKHNLESRKLDLIAKREGKIYKLNYKTIDDNTIEISNKDSVALDIAIATRPKKEASKIWQDVGQYSARALMSIRSISFNYSKRKDTHIAGYREHIGNVFGQRSSDYGLAPGLGFAFGLQGGEDFVEKALRRDWLVNNTENIMPAIFTDAEKFEFQMRLEPITGLLINLNAHRERSKRTDLQYMYEGMPRNYGGTFSMTTISLAGSFDNPSPKNNYHSKAFEKFLDNRDVVRARYEKKFEGKRYPNGGFIKEDNPHLIGQQYDPRNGNVNLNSGDVLIPAFIAAYTGGGADKVSLSVFPSLLRMLPNWGVSYNGLSKIPGIEKHFNSIILNHNYKSIYQIPNHSSHSDWLEAEDGLGFIRDVLDGTPMPSSPYSFSSVDIVESFFPLIGAEASMKNNMSIRANYNRSRLVSLNLNAYQIVETLQRDFVVGFGYRIDEFNRLMGFSDRNVGNFNNSLDMKVDLSYKINQGLIRKIEENFTQAISGSDITTIKISADYAFSKSFSLRAFFDRIMNKPLVTSNGYATSNNNFGLSVKFILTQ